MTSANVELARSIYADWDRGDYSSTDWADPEIEFVIADWVVPGRWKGLAGMAEGFREILNAWDEFRTEAEEYLDVDEERVLVLVHFSGRGKTSGVDVGQMRTRGASLFSFRDGKATRLAIYFDGGRALAEVGLPPEADSPRS